MIKIRKGHQGSRGRFLALDESLLRDGVKYRVKERPGRVTWAGDQPLEGTPDLEIWADPIPPEASSGNVILELENGARVECFASNRPGYLTPAGSLSEPR